MEAFMDTPTTAAAVPHTSRMDWIPVDLIDLHPLARSHSQEGLASLNKDMQKQGQLQNIVVCPKEGGRYEVIAGAGRLQQARALKWEKISASIRGGLSEFQKLDMMLSENDEREP